MDPQVAYKLVEEVRQQSRFGWFAWQNLRQSLQSLDAEKTFFFVHALLHRAWVLSRFFWPERESSRARGEWLRTELKMDENSPLRLSGIAAQVAAEDERFEDWLSTLDSLNYMDMNIMPQGSISGYKQDTFHRSLDPETYRLNWRGTPCDLRKLADAFKQLEAQTSTWLRTHEPW